MRRALAVMALAALTACGSGSSTPSTGSSTGSQDHHASPLPVATGTPTPLVLMDRPHVTTFGSRLIVGVGRAAVVQLSSGVLVAGGLVLGDTTTDVVQQVDLVSGTVRRLPPLAVPVHDTAGALPGGRVWVIGGGNSSEQSVVQGWHGTWSVIGHLPTTRSDLTVVQASDGKPYVLGGYDGVTPTVSAVLTSTNGKTWTNAGSVAVPVRYAAGVWAAGKVFLFGGEVSNAEQDVIQTWDPATGKGVVVGHLPTRLGHMSAVAVGPRILLVGGRTDASSGAMTNAMWWFDPTTLKLTDAGRLPYAVADAALVLNFSDHQAYLIGGESPHPIATILKIQVTS